MCRAFNNHIKKERKLGKKEGREEQYDLIARVTKELVRLKREDEIIKINLDKNYFNLLVKQFGFEQLI